jgi:hypothetical protein
MALILIVYIVYHDVWAYQAAQLKNSGPVNISFNPLSHYKPMALHTSILVHLSAQLAW